MEHQKETPQQTISLAAESVGGLDDAAALPFRLARYDKARRRSLLMRDYALLTGGLKEAAKLHDCGSWLLFRDYHTVGKIRLSKAPFCHQHLLCPLCAIRRGAKALKVYLDRLQHIRLEHPHAKLYLVTFTVKNGEDLCERNRHITSAMQRYQMARRRYLSNPKAYKHVEMAKAIGAVGSYETKRGENSGLWHPHCHMIWLCYEEPDQDKLRAEWEEITGDSFMCDVRPFRDDQDPAEAFMEVFKYAVKFSDMPLSDNWMAYKTLKTRRMLFSFGAFYGVKVPDDLTDEGLDDLPYLERFYRHTAGGYSFVSSELDRHRSGQAKAFHKTRERPGEDVSARSGSEDGNTPSAAAIVNSWPGYAVLDDEGEFLPAVDMSTTAQMHLRTPIHGDLSPKIQSRNADMQTRSIGGDGESAQRQAHGGTAGDRTATSPGGPQAGRRAGDDGCREGQALPGCEEGPPESTAGP